MAEGDSIELVYDGDCPFCSASAKMVRVKKAVGALVVHDARQIDGTPLMDEISARGLDLNEGIVVKFQGRLYDAEDAVHLLAMIGSSHDWLNRLNVALFRHRAVVTALYPAMRAMRNLALKARGARPI